MHILGKGILSCTEPDLHMSRNVKYPGSRKEPDTIFECHSLSLWSAKHKDYVRGAQEVSIVLHVAILYLPTFTEPYFTLLYLTTQYTWTHFIVICFALISSTTRAIKNDHALQNFALFSYFHCAWLHIFSYFHCAWLHSSVYILTFYHTFVHFIYHSSFLTTLYSLHWLLLTFFCFVVTSPRSIKLHRPSNFPKNHQQHWCKLLLTGVNLLL